MSRIVWADINDAVHAKRRLVQMLVDFRHVCPVQGQWNHRYTEGDEPIRRELFGQKIEMNIEIVGRKRCDQGLTIHAIYQNKRNAALEVGELCSCKCKCCVWNVLFC